MAENKNNFDTTVASLFKGMDSFVSAKTVVGDAVTVNDTIILPLVDVSFGVGAGAFAGEKKNNAGGTGCVGAGRPHHHRPHNVKKVHTLSSFKVCHTSLPIIPYSRFFENTCE